ncbi:hypothetical protein HZS_5181 [Henneguya salminicola]|nr:hypothetical protein HZS_5181 [Henneguya salminicola]
MNFSHKRKRKVIDKQKGISFEEKNQLSEIDFLYSTNLFKLQSEEFIREIKNTKIPNESIELLKNRILSTPPIEPASLEDHVSTLKNGKVLLPIPDLKFNNRQQFECPGITTVEVIGSYNDFTFTRNSDIDILIDFPIKISKTDIKSRNYILKRAIVLSHIARNVKLLKGFDETSNYTETPFYNQYILKETQSHADFDLSQLEFFKEALILIKCWLQNRPFGRGFGCLTGFMVKIVLLYLLHQKLIHQHMNSYQVIRIVYDSAHALRSLNVSTHSSFLIFQNIFLKKLNFNEYFDNIFEIKSNNTAWVKEKSDKLYTQTLFDIHPSEIDSCLVCIHRILKRGLSTRVTLCCYKHTQPESWPIDHLPHTLIRSLQFGIILKDSASDELVVLGPSANENEAVIFREFWGNLSRVMKFMDGSVREVVKLSPKSKEFQQSSYEQIVRHLLDIHCNISSSAVRFLSSQLDKFLNFDPLFVKNYLDLEKAFMELSNTLNNRSFNGLSVKGLLPMGSVFSRTSIWFPVNATQYNPYKTIINAYFKISTKNNPFKDDLMGFNLHNLLLMAQIAQYLKESGIPSFLTSSTIEVIYRDFVFSFELYVPRQLKILYNKGLNDSIYKELYHINAKKFHFKSAHVNFIRGFSVCYSSFFITVRLFKRWISSQLLSDLIPDEICELLVAYVYSNPHPYYHPQHYINGLKQVLKLIYSYDWVSNLMVVSNKSSSIDGDVIINLERILRSSRSQLPPIVIVVPYDLSGAVWSSQSFTPVAMKRLIGLAKAASDILDNLYEETQYEDLTSIFIPNPLDFHIIIDISCDIKFHDATTHFGNGVHSTHFLNKEMEFYENLKAFYNEIIDFFFDSYEPYKIYGVFKTNNDEVNFNVTNSLHRSPINTQGKGVKGKCKIDLERLAIDIKLMGNKICERVTYNQQTIVHN